MTEQWLPDPADPTFLYHYTTPQAVIGICESRQLFAGYPLDMNDRREQLVAFERAQEYLSRQGKRGASLLKTWLQLREDNAHSSARSYPFIISFSAAVDSLMHWMTYAQPYGSMAMGFMANHLRHAGSCQTNGVQFTLGKCVYDEEVHRGEAERVAEAALVRFEEHRELDMYSHVYALDRELAVAGAFMKDPNFHIEQEWRLVSSLVGLPPAEALAFRAGKYGIREFLKFDIWAGLPEGMSRPEVNFLLGPNSIVHSDLRVTDSLGSVLGTTATSWGYSQSSYRN